MAQEKPSIEDVSLLLRGQINFHPQRREGKQRLGRIEEHILFLHSSLYLKSLPYDKSFLVPANMRKKP
jgi:hypothetical protein